jgi:hypothetical protein
MSATPNYYLITSSGFFIIPALYGIYRGHSWLPMFTILSASGSIVFWMNPANTSLRLIDQIISRTSGILYSSYGLWTINDPQIKIIFWLDIILMLSTYHTSCRLYYSSYHHCWIPYHMMFHYFCIISQLLVL